MKVVTFGEALFRTVTKPGVRLSQATQLNFYLGGTELNVAANLKSLGVNAEWVSALPAGLTGDLIREKINYLGIDISNCMQLPDNQIGWYLMEAGIDPRPDIVLHRNSSGMAKASEFTFDWQQILAGAYLFHTSGVTAGLSAVLTDEIKKAMQTAKEMNLLVSYDLNYRKNLWDLKEFVIRQEQMFDKIDILFCSNADLKLFFGDSFTDDHFLKVFSNSSIQILVLVNRSADNSEYGIKAVSRDQQVSSKKYKVNCLDRIGIGDSAAAGFIKSYLGVKDIKAACEWAALAGALKYGIYGDMALLKVNEIKNLFKSQHSGIIR